MKFEPEFYNTFENGDYKGRIVFVNMDGISKNMKPKCELKIHVKDKFGHQGIITDHVTLDKGFLRKFCHLCKSAGISDKYNTGEINNADLLDKTVCVRLIKDTFNGKEFNKVEDYLAAGDEPEIINHDTTIRAAELKKESEKNASKDNKNDQDIPF